MDLTKVKELLTLHEGKRNSIYKCSQGFNTIGIGHNLDANPLSDRAIDVIFEDDLNQVIAALDRRLPWWRTLSENRQHVLIDMCFNMGINALLGFHNTLTAMEKGRYEEAAIGMGKSRWASQVGTRAIRLIKMMGEG